MATEKLQKNTEVKVQKLTLTGVVVSTKMKDTVVVRVDRYVKHPIYQKFQTRSQKFKVHDAGNTVKEGQTVTIQSTRPISKTKHFIIVK
jgi:small subunit ribosomal protein S17